MQHIHQGDLLKIVGLPHPVVVVSNDFFNQEGKAIVCPIVPKAVESPLHIRIKEAFLEGWVLCEQVKYMDLSARRYTKMPAVHYFDIMDLSDAVMGMFEYQ